MRISKFSLWALAVWLAHVSGIAAAARSVPNFVVILADDLGYGDLSGYGHPTIRTPHLDRMAREGMKFTDFYAAASVCSPTRAALLTGRLPVRSGMFGHRSRVFFPDSLAGLPPAELTLPEALQDRGYATACIGKWHLGHGPEYLPRQHGFDRYFGVPYSNDMDRAEGSPPQRAAFENPKVEYWNVPLMRDEEVIERPADQRTLTRRYTEETIGFIREHKEEPFFVYLAHSFPHVPLFASAEFSGRSRRGLYGDVVEELDWSVGQILEALRQEGLADNTLVIFTSDNGPWLTHNQQGGSAGLLRDGKGTTWEGGMRVPAIAWWPGKVPAGSVCREIASVMDFLPTLASLAEAPLAPDRLLDGADISPLLLGKGDLGERTLFYYRDADLFAVRQGRYKAHFITRPGYGSEAATFHQPAVLYDLDVDPSEKYDVAAEHADVLEDLLRTAETHKATVVPAPALFDRRSR